MKNSEIVKALERAIEYVRKAEDALNMADKYEISQPEFVVAYDSLIHLGQTECVILTSQLRKITEILQNDSTPGQTIPNLPHLI